MTKKIKPITKMLNEFAANDGPTMGNSLRTMAKEQDMDPMTYLLLLEVDAMQCIANELRKKKD